MPLNSALVGMAGDDVVIVKYGIRMPREEALVMAAFIVAMAEKEEGEFRKILEDVENG